MGNESMTAKSNMIAENSSVLKGLHIHISQNRAKYTLNFWVQSSFAHLCWPPVLPACCDMSDDTGVALLADIDAVHLDDALARMETRDGSHRAWQETRMSQEKKQREECQKLIH